MSNSGLSYCQILIGQAMTGLIGLPEILEALAQEGVPPDAPGLGQRLVAELRKYNYVPKGAVSLYEAALLREYNRYLRVRASGAAERIWRDPRKEHKPWYPTLFAEKCNGCGECLKACPNGVLGWNPEHTKVLVLEPYECAPGCEQCAKACAPQAIIMPPRAVLYQRVEKAGVGADPCQACSAQDCTLCEKGAR